MVAGSPSLGRPMADTLRITPERAAELARLDREATPGPWEARGCAVAGPFTAKGHPALGLVVPAMLLRLNANE